MEETFKTTADDYKLFKSEATKWIDKFGLKEFGIEFRKVTEHDGSIAYVSFNNDYTAARISFNTVWYSKPNAKEVKKTALHEVTHILTIKLEMLCMERFTTKDAIYDEIERIARRMENAIYE